MIGYQKEGQHQFSITEMNMEDELHECVWNKNPLRLRQLLDSPDFEAIHLTRKNGDGTNPFTQAAAYGDLSCIVVIMEHPVLKKHGISLDDLDGCSALLYASENGYPYVVDYLLSKGVPPDCLNPLDQFRVCTPLMHALRKCHIECAYFIMKHAKYEMDTVYDAMIALFENQDEVDMARDEDMMHCVKRLHKMMDKGLQRDDWTWTWKGDE